MTQTKDGRNSSQTLFGKILTLDLDACEIQLFLASLTEDDTPDFQCVTITSDVATEFRDIVKKTVAKRKKDSDKSDLVLQAYDPQTKLDQHEVEYLDLSAHTSIKNQITALADITSLACFSEDHEFITKLRFYVLMLKPKKSRPVFFFRSYTSKKELNRSRLFALVFKRGHYDRFSDRLFLFDQIIDCVVRGDLLFILNKDNFQKIFRFYDMLVGTAKQTLQIIQARIPIDDFSAFETACEGHLQKLAKLKNIASKPYLQKITMKDIKRVINKYKLPILTVGSGKNEKVKFDPLDKWAILRLLDDNYLESVMTGNSYEVNSKRAITETVIRDTGLLTP